MPVKAVVLAGSPRVGGNSDILAERLVAGLRAGGAEVELLHARALKVGYCRACYYCSRTGECIQTDDMQRLYRLFSEGHRLCLVTPVFFCQTPSITQAIIERCQTLWTRKYHRHEALPELAYPRQG
ncbi:MAG: flavodoxin family protein, partial [Anaerolineae bacterium]